MRWDVAIRPTALVIPPSEVGAVVMRRRYTVDNKVV